MGQTERVLGNPGQRAEEGTVTVQRAAFASCASVPDVPSHGLGPGWRSWALWRGAGLETKANIYPSESALSYPVVLAFVCPLKL